MSCLTICRLTNLLSSQQRKILKFTCSENLEMFCNMPPVSDKIRHFYSLGLGDRLSEFSLVETLKKINQPLFDVIGGAAVVLVVIHQRL